MLGFPKPQPNLLFTNVGFPKASTQPTIFHVALKRYYEPKATFVETKHVLSLLCGSHK
jgi:hypothetical protein